ncbi:MAG: hypothetical protein CMI54_08040 [Parcubacteria group bacterium]|jgi:hypothetical protein|nr:hypothetical protein [Parcubacteria group bacterium]|tara:strand:+ start:359 stop:571 length:213 start_codon:yes stop_codon:yes gene_type:complete
MSIDSFGEWERDRQGRLIKRCPNCDRPRQMGWSDVCKSCQKEYARKEAWYKSDEYKAKVKRFHETGKFVP